MAIFFWKNAKLYVNELDISAQSNQLKLDYNADMLDASALGGGTTRIHKPGLWDAKLAHLGFVDFADDAIDDALHATAGSSTLINHTILPYPTGAAGIVADGDHAYFGQFVTAQYSGFQSGIGELASFLWNAEGAGQLAIGRVSIDPETAVSGVVDGTAYELGNAASYPFGGNIDVGDRVCAMVHVTADDFSDLDFVLESDDVENFGGTPETIASSLNHSGVGSAFLVTAGTAAITDDWFRLRVSGFTGTSATVVGVVGVLRGR